MVLTFLFLFWEVCDFRHFVYFVNFSGWFYGNCLTLCAPKPIGISEFSLSFHVLFGVKRYLVWFYFTHVLFVCWLCIHFPSVLMRWCCVDFSFVWRSMWSIGRICLILMDIIESPMLPGFFKKCWQMRVRYLKK